MGGRRARLDLAWAYLRHELRRRFGPPALPPAETGEVLRAYVEEGLQPLTPVERERLPAMSRCVGCGICALVVRRAGQVRPPDLAGAYLRDLTLLPLAEADLEGGEPAAHALAAASAACPVGVPLDEVAAVVRRLAGLPAR